MRDLCVLVHVWVCGTISIHNQDAELSHLPEAALLLFRANIPCSQVRTAELRARSIYILGGHAYCIFIC